MSDQFEYDLAISFADEDRDFANTLAGYLRKEGARIFYDDDLKSNLLGKNLQKEFKKISSILIELLVLPEPANPTSVDCR